MGRDLPQPREGVRGVRRTQDDLLSLEPTALMRRSMMLRIACGLWMCTLDASMASERGRDRCKRMNDPRLGDLVAEVTSMRHPDSTDGGGDLRLVHGFGIMLGRREEWICSDEDWARELEAGVYGKEVGWDGRATADAVYVQYGPEADDIVRWVNADIIALPAGMLYHTEEMQR